MMAWGGACIMVAGFIVIFIMLRLADRAKSVNRIARDALQLVRDQTIDDDQKEKQMQSYALQMFGLAGILAIGGAAAVMAPLALVWLLEQLGILLMDEVLALVVSPSFLIGTTAVICVGTFVYRRIINRKIKAQRSNHRPGL